MKTLHTIYSTFAKHNMAKFLTVLTILLIVGVGSMLGATDVSEFTSKNFEGLSNKWTKTSSGTLGYEDARGVQHQKNATTTFTATGFSNVTKVQVWVAKSSKGAGSVKIQENNTSKKTISSFSTSSTEQSYSWTTPYTGTLKIVVNATASSIYIKKIVVTTKAATCTKPTISWATAPTDGNVGETMTASVSTNYSDGLSYSSSNTSVATIDNSGKITYEAAGTTTITASVTGDGTTYCSETVSVTQKITVSKSCTSITPSLSYAPATIVVGETTSPTLTGNTGNGTVTYSSNKTSVATVDASTGTVTAKSAGTATITANIATNGDYCAGSATFEITVNKKSATITLSEAGSTSNPSGTFYIGDSYTLPSSDATCDGKEFVGWSTEQIQTPTDNPTATIHVAGTNVTLAETNTFYAVFATVGEPEGTTTEEVTRTYIFSNYTAGTQYASDEEHILDDDVTIYTTNCHFTTQLRIYSSSSNNGYVVSNQLPGQIVSIGMNAGNKVDEVLVYGSSDGSTWKQVGSISVTSTSYKDYILSFGDTDYTYFKLDVKGSNQVRLQSLTITWETSAASNEPTYSQYTTSCSGKTGTTLTWSADKYLTTINGDTNFPTLTTSPADLTGVTYSSSNTSVATINATTGAITVIGLGETTITASYAGNDTYDAATDATYTLTVADIFTISYAVGNGDTAPDNNTVVQGNKVTLPNLNTTLNCVSFVGWTDAQNGYNHGTSQLYKAGAEYTPTATITLHAVYGVGAGYVLVEDVATLTAGMQVIIANTDNNVAMGAQNENNRAEVSVTISDKTLTPADGVEIFTLEEGTTAGTFAFKTSAGYIYAAGSSGSSGKNYLKTTSTLDERGSWKITITSGVTSVVAQGTNTRNTMQYNSGSSLFSCYASASQKSVSLYAQGVANYTTDPECMTYSVSACDNLTNGTITIEKTTVDPYGSTNVTFVPNNGYMLESVIVTPSNKATVQEFTADVTGNRTLKISNIQSDIEVCATFKAIPYYKVTFVDMNNGNAETIVPQSEFGGDITAPATASDGCDVTWTFIGWAPSNSLNGTTEVPANLVEAGGTISGANITNNNLIYYSVYSNSSDGTPPFSIGKSGTYYMYALDGSTKYYATTNRYGSALYAGHETTNDFTTYPKAKVKLAYNSNTNKYKIQITTFGSNPTNGYLYHPDKTENDLTHNSDNYTEFTLQQGNALGFNIVYAYTVQQLQGSVYVPVEKTGCFGRSSNYFQGSSTITDVYFEPASEMHYYNASICTELVTMSFDVPADAVLTYADGYPEGYYKDSEKKTITTFPTLEYAGWTFIGWTAGTPYNDVIGEDYLNDENSSADAPTQDIYKTGGGLSYYLGGDVTMYPVFTKFEDNEPFDMVNGGDYYIYYIADGDIGTSVDEYGAANRIYAAEYRDYGFGSTQSCATATLFTFTKLSNGKWTIYDNTRRKFVYGVNNDNKLEDRAQTADGKLKFIKEWTIEVVNGNQVNAVSVDGYVLSASSANAISGTFKNYDDDNLTNGNGYQYHRVYVGTCTERVYSSNPSNKPTITLNGEPVVTSTKDQSIRARGELSISATKLAANGIITLTADNEGVYFSTVKDANFTQATKQPLASLPLYADEKGKLAMTTVYVHYKPTSTSTLGIQTANITATTGTNGQPDYATATTTAALRNLPADFVIAAKWGDNWYALPANMDSQSSTEGLLIEVDDAANPTKAIAAPNTTKYGVKSVYTSNSTADRYADNGERLVFVENVEETTPVTNKTLYNGGDASGSKTNIQVYAQYANYYSDQNQAPRYEWIPTTTDLTDYTLTSGAILSGDAVGRTVSLDNHGIFGTLLQDKSYNGMVRLLPVDNFYEPIELQVVEWKQYSVSVMYTGAGTKATTKVGSNEESDIQLKKIDHAVYSLSTADLTTATNQPLIIYIKNDADDIIGAIKLTIPAIVATDKTSTELGVTEENAKATSIVVLGGATLTADATKYTYDDITVYPGGNLIIDDGKSLGMYTLTLRAGSSWGAAEYENKYPQLLVRGDYSNTSGQINLDYVTTQDYYYPLSVPEEVTIDDIKYPVEIYGSNVEKNNKGSFQLKYYDGAQRATGATGWVVLDENNITKLSPNSGYAFWGIPKKVSVNGAAGVRQTYGIHRIPIKIAADKLLEHEKINEEITIQAYAAARPNDQGWNYLGNPYLAGLGGMNGSDEDLLIGLLEKEIVDGQWTGGWVYNEESVNNKVRYITITNDCQNFEALPVANAKISPFTTFFIQAASVDDQKIRLTTPASILNVSSLPARHYAAQQVTAKEITTGILLSGNDQTDRTGLLIADNFTEEYDFNADLSKFENSGINLYTIGKTGNLAYMAINQALAEQPIPVGYTAPAEGLYTIAFDEDRYNATDINALYLIDYDSNEKTNLLHTDYSFVTAAGTNNQRFALQVAFAPENATNVEWVGDATIQVGVEGNTLMLNNLPNDAAVHVFDALGRLMYHAPTVPTEMQLTLPTGYYLVRIADKQNAVVIKTVIP